MLSGFWSLPGGDRALSRVDPFRLSWPDEFDRMARRLEEDMWRRHRILEELEDSLWRDSLLFFNNPERSRLASQDFSRSISSSVEHHQHGKEHTFKRSITVNGKTDTVTAKYDGEKTVVTYDGDKTVELPGFYDITVDVVKQGNEVTKAIDDKLANMNKQLRGELGMGDTQMKLEQQGQQQQGQQQQQQQQIPHQAS